MYSFGKNKLRSLESFGVSGILAEKADVFYDAVFSTRHVGRISDLLVARLQSAGINELKLRALIIFTAFHGYRGQLKKRLGIRIFSKNSDDVLDKPILLECGIDNEKVAIGVCFTLNKTSLLKIEGISDRIFRREPTDPFEEMLVQLQDHSDRLILKFQPETSKIEIISVLGIEGKIDRMALQTKEPMEVVVLTQSDLQPAPRPRCYSNFGDLDYSDVTRIERGGKSALEFATGAFLMPADQFESEEEIPVGEVPLATSANDDEAIENFLKKAGFTGKKKKQGDLIEESEGSPRHSRTPGFSPEFTVNADEAHFGVEFFFSRVRSAIRRFFDRFLRDTSSAQNLTQETLTDEDLLKGLGQEDLQDESSDLAGLLGESGNPEIQAKSLLMEFRVGGINKLLTQASQEFKTVRKAVKDPRIVTWVEGVLGGAFMERARLHAMAKKLERTVRLKEHEHKLQLTALEKELKNKESQLLSKTHALSRSREQLIEVTGAVERLKAVGQVSVQREPQKNVTNVTNDDYAVVLKKYQHLYRQAEEFKKVNRQLIERLAELKKAELKKAELRNKEPISNSMGSDPTQRRLEAAMKLVGQYRKNTESIKSRCITLEQQDLLLRDEINRLNEELKKREAPLSGSTSS